MRGKYPRAGYRGLQPRQRDALLYLWRETHGLAAIHATPLYAALRAALPAPQTGSSDMRMRRVQLTLESLANRGLISGFFGLIELTEAGIDACRKLSASDANGRK